MEKVKSELQKGLEAEGWEFLTNEDTSREYVYGDDGRFNQTYPIRPKSDTQIPKSDTQIPKSDTQIPKSDTQIRQEYLGRNFKEVRIENSYDIEGNPISQFRAIYVKR